MTRPVGSGNQVVAESKTPVTNLLFELYFGFGTQYFTNCDRVIVWSGHTYQRGQIGISKVTRSSEGIIDSIEVTASNVKNEYAAILAVEPVRGKRIVIRKLLFAADGYTFADPFVLFDGKMDEIAGKKEETTSTVAVKATGELAYWQKTVPGSTYGVTCRLTFNYPAGVSPRCGYVGAETWCNRTPERCSALNNRPNFSGHRHLAALEGAPIYWGRTRPLEQQ